MIDTEKPKLTLSVKLGLTGYQTGLVNVQSDTEKVREGANIMNMCAAVGCYLTARR